MTRLLVLICLLFGTACGNQLSGTVDDVALGEFADAVYFELRYTRDGIEQHDVVVWMMPMEDSCTVFPALLADLAEARRAIDDDSLDAETYCEQWEAVWLDHLGLDPFWMARYTLRAKPRPASAGVDGDYPWLSRDALNDGPVFDADLARYAAPTFAACAEEFQGAELYAPALHRASSGALTVTRHTEDEELVGRVEFGIEAADSSLSGTFETTFCPGAIEWPLEFGLGL
jgi:hypothetical protein